MFEEKGNPSLDCWDWDTMVPPLVEEAAPDSSGLLPILGLPESGSSKEGSCGTCGDPNSGCGDCGSNQGSQEFQIVALQ